jgi:hypothetical protein
VNHRQDRDDLAPIFHFVDNDVGPLDETHVYPSFAPGRHVRRRLGADIVCGVEQFNMQTSGATSYVDLAVSTELLRHWQCADQFRGQPDPDVNGANHIDMRDFIF